MWFSYVRFIGVIGNSAQAKVSVVLGLLIFATKPLKIANLPRSKTHQHFFIPDILFFCKKLKELFDSRFKLIFRTIPNFTHVPFSEMTIGDAFGDFINTFDIGIPA